jgi:preprotein translocase subunit SecA
MSDDVWEDAMLQLGRRVASDPHLADTEPAERFPTGPRPREEVSDEEIVAAVGEREAALAGLADRDLTRRAVALRERVRAGERPDDSLDDLRVESFALVRETARRVLGQRPYDEQILCGVVLYRGAVAEMQTGEGKTLAAVAPTFLHALAGRGAHVLTYNDYLARRDAEWMGPVYEHLGLSVGCVHEKMDVAQRRAAYRCDVTYVTAKEAGFDLLRDQLCLDPEDQVHRPFHCALVDEADSILIDEARVPLVIAGDVRQTGSRLHELAAVARRLEPGVDHSADEHYRNVFLTERGARRAEELLRDREVLGETSAVHLFSPESSNLLAELRNALHAEVLLRRDVDYIVRRARVELVDELTGRVAENRKWPDGLQAAVEAKEGLAVRDEGVVLGSITLQHFLRLYPRLAGMTGTAVPAAEELGEVYGLEVVEIPTHEPCIREDHPDRVFLTREAKHAAVIDEIVEVHATGRPVLVGTVSVEESERLATDLAKIGVSCRVLNARNDHQEAAIVAEAGRPGAVTLSTNMAGRGTDIRLGGADEAQRERVVALGGLYVIGTNRHESRRIDDQLRGRAGRQGDPGSSRFFVSLEDDLMVKYRVRRLLPPKILERCWDGGLDHPAVVREIARVQRIVEGESFDIRKRLYQYSSILESQRRLLGDWRQGVLDGSSEVKLLQERLREHDPGRWRELRARVGDETLERVERRLTLLMIDRSWSEHLADLQQVRDEIHLVQLDGRQPVVEFYRLAIRAFEDLLERIDDEIVRTFESIEITRDGVDWEREGLLGPSSTWTYLVSDNVFGGNTLLSLANRPSIGVMAVMLPWLGPVLFLWGIFQHWLKRRKMKALDREEGSSPDSPDSH